MDDSGINEVLGSVSKVFRRAWRRRRLALGVAWVVSLAAALAIPWVPQRYEASARIYVDTQSVLKPLMEGLAYQPDIDQQVRMLARTVISRPNLERLLDRPELGLAAGTPVQREATLTQLMGRIKLALTEAGLYTISFRDTSPERAERMVEAIVGMFMHSSSGDKMRDSADASRFIADQIQSYEVKLIDAESRLKEFKVRNFGVTGVSNQDYFARMSTLADDLNRLRADLRAAEQARDAYRRELAGEDPQLPRELTPLAAPPPLSDVDTALAGQHKNLDDLLTRYTERHPDVIATRRQIAELEERKRQDGQSKPEGPAKSNGAAATSPVYQRLRVALAENEAQVASLRSRVAAEQQRLDEVRSVAGRVPQVEAELAQLNRDYDVIRKNYDQLVARREAAAMGIKLDESARLADFRIIEPPRVSPTPVFPGRVALVAMAIAGSLALGLLAPTIRDSLQPTIESAEELRLISSRPVIGTLSKSFGAATERSWRLGLMGFGAAAVTLLALQAVWLGWAVTRTMV